MKPKVAILINDSLKNRVITEEGFNKLRSFADLIMTEAKEMTFENTSKLLKEAEACMTCWGSIPFTKELLDCAPDLKLVCHSAGSIKRFVTDEFYNRGLQITSAAAANGMSVAEHTLGMMIAMLKRSFWINDYIHKNGWSAGEEHRKCKALYGVKVGIVGAGYIGRYLINLLKNFHVQVILYDPFVSKEEAQKLGVIKDELNNLMAQCDVVSLHAPNIPETRHMINKDNLKLLMDGAVLINTARGALIDEKALYEEAKDGRISLCLDVCDPEPMLPDNPLLKLSNVILTHHTAGALAKDVSRMGDMAIQELENYFSGKPLMHSIKREDLPRMA